MKPSVAILSLLWLIIAFPAAGQSILNEYNLQPEVWRPAKPIEHGVDAQGDLGLSIPVMTVPGRGMDFPIALTYRSGITAKQVPGWLGLGWSFDPGSITRDVQNVTTGTGTACVLYNVDYTTNPTYQQDVYNVSTPGGSFTMGKYKTGTGSTSVSPPRRTYNEGDFVAVEWEPWKIEYDTQTPVTVNGISTTFVKGTSAPVNKEEYSKFIITATDGTRYIFAHPTLSTFDGAHPTSSCASYENYVSTWRIVAILGPDYVGTSIPTKNATTVSPGSWVLFEYTTPITSTSASDASVKFQSSFLTKIVTPSHRAVFTVEVQSPVGVFPNPWGTSTAPFARLASITLHEDYTGTTSKIISKVQFDQMLHSGVNVNRIGLSGIKFFGGGGVVEQPGYKFTYYTPSGETNAANFDNWGYYNTTDQLATNTDTTDAKAWSLQSITHPTGGYEKIHYTNDTVTLPFNFSTFTLDPIFVSYNNYDNIMGSGGTATYMFNEQNNRQGGVRVTKTERYEKPTSTVPLATTIYSYGDGRVSGVPPEVWTTFLPTAEFFKPASRGRAGIFYTSVKRINADGTTVSTSYTTDLFTEVKRLQSTFFKNNTVATVIQGNQDINWGIPYEIVSTENGTIKTSRTISLNPSKLAGLLTYVGEVNMVWKYKNFLESEIRTESMSTTFNEGDDSVTNRVDYTYDVNTGLPTLVKESGDAMPTRLTELTYPYQTTTTGYTAMDNLNILTPPVRVDIAREISSTIKNYYRSKVTTWKLTTLDAAGSVWLPFKEYEWINGTSSFSTSKASFSDWGNTTTPSSTVWHRTVTYDSYDDWGHLDRIKDARDKVTDLFYGDNNACSSAGTTKNHAYLTCVRKPVGGVNMDWQIEYDSSRVKKLKDPNLNTTPRFTYDKHGRLLLVKNADDLTVTQYKYFMSRTPASADYNSTTPNYIQTQQQTGSVTYYATEYLDSWGRTIQSHQRDGSYDFITAIDYDDRDRPWKTWKSFRKLNSAHGYISTYAADALANYDGSPAANAYGEPFVELLYSAGKIDKRYSPSISTTRDFQSLAYLSEPYRDPQGVLLTGNVRFTATTDETGQVVHEYVDGMGRPFLTRRFSELTAPTGIPADQTVTATKSSSGGAGPQPMLPLMDWDVKSYTYSPPAGAPPHLVTYTITLSVTGTAASYVQFFVNGEYQSNTSYNTEHPTNVYTGSFVAYTGTTYKLEAHAGAAVDFAGSATATFTMKFKTNGMIRSLVDTRQELDVMGNPITVMPPNYFSPPHGTADNWKTTYTYDTRGRMLSKTTPDGGLTGYRYDFASNLRFSQDARQAAAGKVSFTTYDDINRPLTTGEAAATFSTLDGNTTNSWESTTSNWLSAFFYGTSSTSKPSTTTFPWSLLQSAIDTTVIANAKGRLVATAQKSNGVWQVELLSYDKEGRVVKKNIYTESLAALATVHKYTYNRQGQNTFRSTKIGTGTSVFRHWYDYHATRGFLEKVYASTSATKPATADVTYTFNDVGLIATEKFWTLTALPYTYNSRDWLTKMGDPATTTYTFSAAFAYLNNGNLSEAEFRNEGSSSANKRFKYAITLDGLNRLKTADYSYYGTSSWTTTSTFDVNNIAYDQNGNLTALQRYRETATLIDNLTYVYDTGKNRLDHVDDAVTTTTETWDTEDAATDAFTYDANGNMLKAQAPYSITSLTYEPRNLPMTMVKGGVTTNYRYSLGGQRYWKAVGAGTPEYYAMDGSVPAAVTNNTGVVTHWNVIANGQVVGRYEGTTKKYYWRDHLGSTRVVVNSSGTVLQADDFYPFGLKMPGRSYVSGAPSKESFTGKERDSETGLDYFGARYYMPALGRWGVLDRFADKYYNMSPYNYAANSPQRYVDVNGDSIIVRGNKIEKILVNRVIENMVLSPSGKAQFEAVNSRSEPTYIQLGTLRGVNDNGKEVWASGLTAPTVEGARVTETSITLDIDRIAQGKSAAEGVLAHELHHAEEYFAIPRQLSSENAEVRRLGTPHEARPYEVRADAIQARVNAELGQINSPVATRALAALPIAQPRLILRQ